MENPAISLAAT